MNWRDIMVIYDHWSYMTMAGILEVVFTALRDGIQICYFDISSNGSLAKFGTISANNDAPSRVGSILGHFAFCRLG